MLLAVLLTNLTRMSHAPLIQLQLKISLIQKDVHLMIKYIPTHANIYYVHQSSFKTNHMAISQSTHKK